MRAESHDVNIGSLPFVATPAQKPNVVSDLLLVPRADVVTDEVLPSA